MRPPRGRAWMARLEHPGGRCLRRQVQADLVRGGRALSEKKRDAFTADEILGHNLEDVLGLGRIFDMLGYLCIYDGDYEAATANLTEIT